jgi:oxygen-dependent protoporphyrinogen oxidase
VGTEVTSFEATGSGSWHVNGERFAGVILAIPAAAAATLLAAPAPDASAGLAQAETADVAMITIHVASDPWPDHVAGLSGYLVPKPAQNLVTAVSFGSQKWAHWRPPEGGQILRVSVGRDGSPCLHHSDDDLLTGAIDDLTAHLGVTLGPLEARITRWPGAFAQYRPHHSAWVDRIEAAVPAGVVVAGASYHGIGVPACIRSGNRAARLMADHAEHLTQ